MSTAKVQKPFRPVRQVFEGTVEYLERWYRLTTPAEPTISAVPAQPEKVRKARLTSTIILLLIFVLLLVLLGGLVTHDRKVIVIIIITILIQGGALWLNKRGNIYFAGLLIVVWLAMALGLFVLLIPGELKVSSIPTFYMLIEIELLAVSLLPAESVFLVALICSLFITANLLLRPHTPELGNLLTTSGFQVILQPILMQFMVAIVSYLWVRSATDAIERADNAEDIARLMHTIAEEKQQRLEALEAEHKITQAYEYQRKLNHLKDQFLVNISHELRTPLTAINGYLELLKEHEKQLDDNTFMLFLTNAMKGCEELTLLVNDVMDAMTITEEIPSPSCEAIWVGQIVRDVLTQMDPQAVTEFKVQISIKEDLQAWADQQYLRQVLRNLLSNAFKYTPQGTAIHIEATQSQRSSPVCISVQDAGPGIPAEELPLLFEKFVRLKRDLAGSTRGTGLGLYISKHLVEAMGGHIWVESSGRSGEGSRFYFTLPCYC